MKNYVAIEKGVYRHKIIGIGSLEQLKPLIFKYFETHDMYHSVEVVDGFNIVVVEYEQNTRDDCPKEVGVECVVSCDNVIVHTYIANGSWKRY